MTRSQVLELVSEIYSVSPEFPWDGETHAVLRHPSSGKWFGIIMDVKKKHLHLAEEKSAEGEETEGIMNVKCDPLLIEDLLQEEAFLPAWHMNKKYWVSIRLSMVTEDALKKLLDRSWDLVKPKVKKKSAARSANIQESLAYKTFDR